MKWEGPFDQPLTVFIEVEKDLVFIQEGNEKVLIRAAELGWLRDVLSDAHSILVMEKK